MGIGRTLIVLGTALVVLGLLFTLGDKLPIPIRLGRLPGDIEIRGKNSVFYFPVVTCILLSVVLSLVMWLFGRRS
jgi:ribose/xylose/arabinose/galactoside ABC-type transport system permease subunit